MSHRFWQQRLGGAPDAVGRTVLLSGAPARIVGVMPPGFSFLDSTVDVWVPIGFDASSRTPRGRWITVVARLLPGTELRQAQAAMDVIAAALAREFPAFNSRWGVTVVSLQEQVVGGVRRAILLLAGAVVILLLVACANAAGLQLARATAREREIAVRVALGAGAGRIVRQLMIESAIVACAAAGLGVGAAWLALRGLVYLAGDTAAIPRLEEIGLDERMLLATIAVSAVTAVLMGLAPALSAARREVTGALASGIRSGGRPAPMRVRRLLGSGQVALALMLLVAAGLVTRSVRRLLDVDPGFRSDQVLTFRVALPEWKHDTPQKRVAVMDRLLAALAAEPGVRSAGAINNLPMTGLGAATSYEALGREKPPLGREPVADVRIVSGDYFAAMGIPLLKGRLFTPHDRGDRSRVIVINETMARLTWPGEEAIGKQVSIAWTDSAPCEVIGVVADVRPERLDGEARAMLYWPHAFDAWSGMAVAVRSTVPPDALARAVPRIVGRIEPDAPASDLRPMDDVLARSVATRRLTMILLASFGGVALALATAGLYAIISYNIAVRRRDIGIRVALGAARRHLVGWVLAQVVRVVAPGIAVGLLSAWLLARYLRDLLFGIRPADPVTFAGTAIALVVMALVAAWLPARGATAVDPIETLRSE